MAGQIDPFSQQLGIIQGTLDTMQKEGAAYRASMDARFTSQGQRMRAIESKQEEESKEMREGLAKLSAKLEVHRAGGNGPLPSWRERGMVAGGTGGTLLLLHEFLKLLGMKL